MSHPPPACPAGPKLQWVTPQLLPGFGPMLGGTGRENLKTAGLILLLSVCLSALWLLVSQSPLPSLWCPYKSQTVQSLRVLYLSLELRKGRKIVETGTWVAPDSATSQLNKTEQVTWHHRSLLCTMVMAGMELWRAWERNSPGNCRHSVGRKVPPSANSACLALSAVHRGKVRVYRGWEFLPQRKRQCINTELIQKWNFILNMSKGVKTSYEIFKQANQNY